MQGVNEMNRIFKVIWSRTKDVMFVLKQRRICRNDRRLLRCLLRCLVCTATALFMSMMLQWLHGSTIARAGACQKTVPYDRVTIVQHLADNSGIGHRCYRYKSVGLVLVMRCVAIGTLKQQWCCDDRKCYQSSFFKWLSFSAIHIPLMTRLVTIGCR